MRDLPSRVLGCQSALPGQAPDLEEVYLLGSVTELAVADACPSGGHLQVSALEHLNVAHRVATVIHRLGCV